MSDDKLAVAKRLFVENLQHYSTTQLEQFVERLMISITNPDGKPDTKIGGLDEPTRMHLYAQEIQKRREQSE